MQIPINFSYDLEVGSGRYFASLESGEIPLLLLFSGTVFSVVDGRFQVQQVPWSKEAVYRLPVSVWREAVDVHFPNSAWITMSRQTFDDLQRFKTRRALPTWDSTVTALLAESADAATGTHGRATGTGAATDTGAGTGIGTGGGKGACTDTDTGTGGVREREP